MYTWFRIFIKMLRKVDGGGTRAADPEYVKDIAKDYVWHEMGFFTSWKNGRDSTGNDDSTLRILCVDTPDEMPKRIKELLEERQQDRPGEAARFADPLALHGVLLDKTIMLSDIAVWRVRDRVREIEQRGHISVRKRFEVMHESSLHQNFGLNLDPEYTMQAQEYGRFQLETVKSMKLRSVSNDKRLDKEITLAFNQIAQSDNTVVKSIAVLSMFFLPSTFVSAIFSTSFFEFQDSGWAMSDKFWIYWAVVIPATLLAPIYTMFAFNKPKKLWINMHARMEKYKRDKEAAKTAVNGTVRRYLRELDIFIILLH
ncbi:uncharacterized protein B0I36DRAFT_388959 [Microdochium trichocladiopsis]|uniref:Mg2+ transporter protein, CorA-like/Zinc transport protein ZntB n=1 Tax=Microdochium trichocladiopsis TaxID=1682393 RepID=A0A9P8XTL7_9PEZI|nr:uncharacterized protein B0I36DRAFT_388959 [Microdochium trichocladiopsis]KAH7016339.1 hypothetical protein B0I36DRAFT_388959 [Microdochium trichocladiopsis]